VEAEADAHTDTGMGAESGVGTNAEGRASARAPRNPTANARAEVLADVECFTGFEPAVLARYMAVYEAVPAPGAALAPFVGVSGKGAAGRPADSSV
jgi:hypothetical protein